MSPFDTLWPDAPNPDLWPQDIIGAKRDGRILSAPQIQSFVHGLVHGQWGDAQVAALGMAVFLRGMDRKECAELTRAMMHSGRVMVWRDLPGPVLDKHSSGGVGDKVSLMLAPMLAACGAYVPMISGRGLGHTGGTCDKLEALPGYNCNASPEHLQQVVREVGCAIVAQTADLAPADRRFYAVRDVAASVESVPLITASILAKKLAAGVQGLVMDVKCGNGAFADKRPMAQELAHSIVAVAEAAGLRTVALITDMNQVLGRTAGHALEVGEALDFLTGHSGDMDFDGGVSHAGREPRLLEVTLALGAELLVLGGLAVDQVQARTQLLKALDGGAAAERFARMVAALGGPVDVLQGPHAWRAPAPVVRAVPALRSGVMCAMATREIGLAVLGLGGGRRRAGDLIDVRVGVSRMMAVGTHVRAGEALAVVHAADQPSAERAVQRIQAACSVLDDAPDGIRPPLVMQRLGGSPGSRW